MKVPFGKYKDKEITELLNDKKYFDWCVKEQIFNQFKTKDSQFFEEINKHIIKPKKIKIVEEKKQCPNLGALIQNTKTYVLAEKADKNETYVCPDCGDKLFLKKGKIRVAHFSHYKKDNPCTYYTHPTESQIHKDAKLLLKYLLENKKVCIKQDCINCKVIKNFNIEEKNDNVDIKLEYKFVLNDKNKFADVGYTMDGQLKYIFEIYNTHLTKDSDRPEPWFEIEATGLINNYKDENNDVNINCIRKKVCNECIDSIEKRNKIFIEAKKILVKYLDHRACNRSGAWMDYPILSFDNDHDKGCLLDELFGKPWTPYEDTNDFTDSTKQFHNDWIPTYETCVNSGYKPIIIADVAVPYKGLINEIWFLDDGLRYEVTQKIGDIKKNNPDATIYSINPNIILSLSKFKNKDNRKIYDYIVKKSKVLHCYKSYNL